MPSFNKDNYEEKVFRVEEGDYPFTVVKADQTFSKAGNEMINLELAIEAGESTIKIYDRLVFTDKALGFIKRFCEATGLDDQWEAGNLEASDCLGTEGVVHIELGEKKDDGKQFMEVAYYLKKGEKPKFSESPSKQVKNMSKPKPTPATVPAAVDEDDIPF